MSKINALKISYCLLIDASTKVDFFVGFLFFKWLYNLQLDTCRTRHNYFFIKITRILSNKTSAFQQNTPQPNVLNSLIVDAMQDNKGKEIVLFDMRQLEEASSDFFVICHGTSNTHIAGILKNVERRIYDEFGIRPSHTEGTPGNWLLLDYFSVVVHVFSEEKRAFYNLDDLWSDAKTTSYAD